MRSANPTIQKRLKPLPPPPKPALEKYLTWSGERFLKIGGIFIDLIHRDVSVGAPSTQYWTQLSSSVAGGLAFATILTLFLTPSLLMIQANTSAWLAKRRDRDSGERAIVHP